MSFKVHQGFFTAMEAGDLAAPDIRAIAVMTNTTADTEDEIVNVADLTTLDENDGTGYARETLTSVVTGWDATQHKWTIQADTPLVFGSDCEAGTRDLAGLVFILHVDGTPANDLVLGFTSDGFPRSLSGGAFEYNLNANGIFRGYTAP